MHWCYNRIDDHIIIIIIIIIDDCSQPAGVDFEFLISRYGSEWSANHTQCGPTVSLQKKLLL